MSIRPGVNGRQSAAEGDDLVGSGFWVPGRENIAGNTDHNSAYYRRPSYSIDNHGRQHTHEPTVEDPSMAAVRDALGGVVPYYDDPQPQSGPTNDPNLRGMKGLEAFAFGETGVPIHSVDGIDLGFGEGHGGKDGTKRNGQSSG